MASLSYLLLGAVAAGLFARFKSKRRLRERQAQALRRAVLRLEAEEVRWPGDRFGDPAARYRRSSAVIPEREIRKVRSVA